MGSENERDDPRTIASSRGGCLSTSENVTLDAPVWPPYAFQRAAPNTGSIFGTGRHTYNSVTGDAIS